MPTESSVVANLIRDLNTRQLPSEPSDSFLFQPAPLDRPPRGTQEPTVIGHESVHAAITTPAKAPAKTTRPARAKAVRAANDGRWWQFALATVLVGGWVYFAGQLDAPAPTKTATFAMPKLPAPRIAAPVVEVPPPAVEQVATPPAPEAPPVPSVATQTTPPKQHHRGPAKVKRKVEKRVTPKAEPAAEVAAPPPPPPPKAVAAPAKPQAQSMDSENPLK